MEAPLFQVIYSGWDSLRRDCEQQIGLGGLLLRSDHPVDQFAQVLVRLVAPDGRSWDLPAEVVQVVPGQGVAVQFAADGQADIAGLGEHCLKHSGDEPDPAGGEPQVFPPGQQPEAAGSAGSPASLPHQLEEMTVAQKRQAALHGRREMRLLLIRDHNKTIHPFVLKNPALTLDEVVQIAKMPSVNPDALRMIATNREWTRSASVCRNLVHNPKTPMREALALLKKLPVSELRALAKSGNVRTAIQQAALKKVVS